MKLTERFGLDSQERQRRLEFLGVNDTDAERLRSIHELAKEKADGIIEKLYEHLLNFEETRKFFSSPEVLERVKTYQRKYFVELTTGATDEAYFENRLRVGDSHQRIELLPQWYLGLYSRYFEIIIEVLRETLGPEKTIEVIPSLAKQMFLDIGLAIDAYIQGGFVDKLRAERNISKDLREELARKEKLAMLGQLAGSVGHELRNPMAAMQTSVYFLKLAVQSDQPKVARHLQLLEQELANADEIITNLLDFSRARQPELSRISAASLVNEVLDRFEWREIELERELEDAYASIDPGQIKQVLSNLVTNSIQAMPEGGKLTARTREENGTVHISISDTGTGMTPEVLSKIFQPLFTTKTKGIGLGLAVCESLVQRNRGRISVVSAPGQGTTFTLEFAAAAQ